MNTFGHNFRISIWGESHAEQVGICIDGTPAGISLSEETFEADLMRRRSGIAGTTTRHETDRPQIVSGVYEGHTTGAPITIVFANTDIRSADYNQFATHPRPSHADWVAACKFGGLNDPRGGGHFSGRLTVALTAAGVVAKQLLHSLHFNTQIVELGGCADTTQYDQILVAAAAAGDSVGGVVECRVNGIQSGVGEPFFDSAESVISHLLFAIPAVKGVEFGNGFEAAKLRGSQNNDLLVAANGATATNHAGGINGGVCNGNELIVRVAVKPTSSIAKEQMTYNFETKNIEPLHIHGRHDTCIALRAAVVVEAAIAIALADLSI
ncbi:MAG: chorismate synthase [Alistipes sp.]